MPRALKVYRTAIGFYDAYVAAPSRKAALEAWGANSDLFAIGAAEVVADPKLTAEPLAAPGTVVKIARGNLSEHLERASPGNARRSSRRGERTTSSAGVLKPRPSRDDLSAAEAALETFDRQARAESAEFARREAVLRKERKATETRNETARARLERQVVQRRAAYERALGRWRDS